jgi:hypothetical protein
MFKRNGSPAKIDEVISFDLTKAQEISCPKCKAYMGLKTGRAFKAVGSKPRVVASGFSSACPKCGESIHV